MRPLTQAEVEAWWKGLSQDRQRVLSSPVQIGDESVARAYGVSVQYGSDKGLLNAAVMAYQKDQGLFATKKLYEQRTPLYKLLAPFFRI